MSIRKYGPCRVCVAFGDERDKEIHGLGLCEKHYQAHRRRIRADDEENEILAADDKQIRELKAHQFVAEKSQKFLHTLNHEHVRTVVPAEVRQEIRLLINPIMVRSQRIDVPRSLPEDMLRENPLDVLRDEAGDNHHENCEATVTSTSEDTAYRRARDNEILETARRNREERRKLAFEIIQAGYDVLEKKYTEPEAFAQLASVTKLLRSMAGSDVLDE